jgi:predicted PurR-regulated permease PerM
MPPGREIVRAVLTVAAVLAGLYLAYRLREVLGLVLMSVFVAVALSPAVGPLVRRRVPRPLAILAVYVAILSTFAAASLVLVPPMVGEVGQLVREGPAYVNRLATSDVVRDYDRRYGIADRLNSQIDRLPGFLNDAAGELESVTVGVFQRAFELITVLTIAFFLLLDGPRIADFAFARFGSGERRVRGLAAEAVRAVAGYVVGSVAIAALAGVVSFGAMTALGLPFAVPLAVVMAFFALVPLVGSAIGALPIAIVAALHSFPTAAIAWVVFFTVYQQVESRVLGPFVYRRTVDLHPLLAIVSVLAGASLAGILGALLAIPAAAIVQILVRDWWRLRVAAPAPAT